MIRQASFFGLFVLLAGSTVLAGDKGDKSVSLFDGKTLKQWHNPFSWGKAIVKDKEIVLTGTPKFFLVSKKTYRDFVLDVELNVPIGGNSGVQFRSHYEKKEGKKTRLWGYQAEVDTSKRSWAGGLYDEGRRGWLVPLKGKPKAQAAFKNGKWNKYRIEAIGQRIRIWVNGVQTVDFKDKADAEGYIALQHHGEKDKIYRFRNIRIRVVKSKKKSS